MTDQRRKERAAIGIVLLETIQKLAEQYSVEVGGDMDAGAQSIVNICKTHQRRLLRIYDALGPRATP